MSGRCASTRPIATTIPPRISETWRRYVFAVGPPASLQRLVSSTRSQIARGWLQGLLSVIQGLQLFCARRRFAVMVTHGAEAGIVLAALQMLAPGRRVPHIMIDCLWYRADRRLAKALQRLKMLVLRISVDRFVVWASHEIDDYARAFALPRERFVFVPFHHTLDGYGVEVLKGDYIFSGGDSDRDYPTLVEAVRGLPVEAIIATRTRNWLSAVQLPPNVHVVAPTPSDFRRLMAEAGTVVVPMKGGLLRSGGQQTYLNAMVLGKPVIVADEAGAADYIVSGETGLIVPQGDAQRLRGAIEWVLAKPDRASELGQAGRKAATVLSTEATMRRIAALALEVASRDRNVDAPTPHSPHGSSC